MRTGPASQLRVHTHTPPACHGQSAAPGGGPPGPVACPASHNTRAITFHGASDASAHRRPCSVSMRARARAIGLWDAPPSRVVRARARAWPTRRIRALGPRRVDAKADGVGHQNPRGAEAEGVSDGPGCPRRLKHRAGRAPRQARPGGAARAPALGPRWPLSHWVGRAQVRGGPPVLDRRRPIVVVPISGFNRRAPPCLRQRGGFSRTRSVVRHPIRRREAVLARAGEIARLGPCAAIGRRVRFRRRGDACASQRSRQRRHAVQSSRIEVGRNPR